MGYDLVKFRNKLKAHFLEFKICYLSELENYNEDDLVSDEHFILKREVVYAPSKTDAVNKLKELYNKCAIINDPRVLKVCNIK